MAAGALEDRLSFHRLGYRTQANYANEELGASARSLRRRACLGKRLARLPKIRAAHESGALPLTKAEAIARVATPETEARWLALASKLRVGELTHVVRAQARRDRGDSDSPFRRPGERKESSR